MPRSPAPSLLALSGDLFLTGLGIEAEVMVRHSSGLVGKPSRHSAQRMPSLNPGRSNRLDRAVSAIWEPEFAKTLSASILNARRANRITTK